MAVQFHVDARTAVEVSDCNTSATWLNARTEGCSITLSVHAGAKRTELCGIHGDALKMKVAAPPVEGAANSAIIDFFSKLLSLKKRRLFFLQGEFSKRKILMVDGLDCTTVKGLIEAAF
jgi:uncharacterized protein